MEKPKPIVDFINKNDKIGLKGFLADKSISVNEVDENQMSALQHACFKGNRDIVQLLLDFGADCHYCEPENNYSCLHFACLSGNSEICLLLLNTGIDSQIRNKINRTASQLAAFVGNYNCVSIIHSFISINTIKQFTDFHQIVEPIQKFLIGTNLSPIRILIHVKNDANLITYFDCVLEIVQKLSKFDNLNKYSFSEEQLFRFFYISRLLSLVSTPETIDRIIKKFLKNDELFKQFLRQCLIIYCHDKRSELAQHMISLLDSNSFKRDSALSVLNIVLFGRENPQVTTDLNSNTECSCCLQMPAFKKCSKCKNAFYCDRQCQLLHWHVHKKFCK